MRSSVPTDALAALVAGECALVATDTVYGLAAVPGSEGERGIFGLKRRPARQALPWLVCGEDMLERYAARVPVHARRLAAMFWPGALTLVLPAHDAACALASDPGLATVAFRCPDDARLRGLIERLGVPLACTSANLHGESTPLCKDHLPSEMRALPGFAELPGTCGTSASTIVDCTGAFPKVLRDGPIPRHVVCDVAVFDDTLPL